MITAGAFASKMQQPVDIRQLKSFTRENGLPVPAKSPGSATMRSVTLVPPSLDSPCMTFSALQWDSSAEELYVTCVKAQDLDLACKHMSCSAPAPVHDSQEDLLDCVNGLFTAAVASPGAGAGACACTCTKQAVVMISKIKTPKAVPAELGKLCDTYFKKDFIGSCKIQIQVMETQWFVLKQAVRHGWR